MIILDRSMRSSISGILFLTVDVDIVLLELALCHIDVALPTEIDKLFLIELVGHSVVIILISSFEKLRERLLSSVFR